MHCRIPALCVIKTWQTYQAFLLYLSKVYTMQLWNCVYTGTKFVSLDLNEYIKKCKLVLHFKIKIRIQCIEVIEVNMWIINDKLEVDCQVEQLNQLTDPAAFLFSSISCWLQVHETSTSNKIFTTLPGIYNSVMWVDGQHWSELMANINVWWIKIKTTVTRIRYTKLSMISENL